MQGESGNSFHHKAFTKLILPENILNERAYEKSGRSEEFQRFSVFSKNMFYDLFFAWIFLSNNPKNFWIHIFHLIFLREKIDLPCLIAEEQNQPSKVIVPVFVFVL